MWLAFLIWGFLLQDVNESWAIFKRDFDVVAHAHLSRICPEYLAKLNLSSAAVNNSSEVVDGVSLSVKDEVVKVASQAMLDNVWSKTSVENGRTEGSSQSDDSQHFWENPDIWATFDAMIEELQRKKKMCAQVVKGFEFDVRAQFDLGFITPPEEQVVDAPSKGFDTLKTTEPLK